MIHRLFCIRSTGKTRAATLAGLFVLLANCTSTGDGNDPAFQASLAKEAQFRREGFIDAGFPAIEKVAASGREVRRLLLTGFLPGRPPVMELERFRDGSVTLLLKHGSTQSRHAVPAALWNEIVALDAGVYEVPRPLPPLPAGWVPMNCHGTIAYFEASTRGAVKSAGAMDCPRALSPVNEARRKAVAALTRTALSTRAGCETGEVRDPGMALVLCFAKEQ